MIKHFALFFLIAFVAACAQPAATVSDSNRLPEPTGEVVSVEQWKEYCERQEWDDPACEVR